jgi:UDP-N-acetylmuramoyl-tripeptide--D-alanyl-D-alanine ligase
MMMTLGEAALAVGGTATTAAPAFTAVSTDSRSVAAGELFIALKGERFDGHAFVSDVLDRGAAGALVEAAWAAGHADLPLVAVDDTRRGLGRLAADWRARFDLPLVGITGSNGKTTVKEMLAAIFRAHFGAETVLATTGNLNNDIGLPMMLLRLRPEHRAAVIEMGMNHPGEIAYLTGLARPTVALVNNAQRAHLEGLGTLTDVARAKGEIFDGLAEDGVAVINADDPHADLWRELAGARRQVSFGIAANADVSGQWTPAGFGGRLAAATAWGATEFVLPVPGLHNARNALAALAAALASGVSLETAARALSAYAGVKGRLQRRAGLNGALVIDDTYNANPDSMRAALDVLAAIPGKHIFVMGDMGEVGEAAGQFHDEIGGYAKSRGVDLLFALGDLSVAAAGNFDGGGRHFKRLEDLVEALKKELGPDTTVLVKGSRFMRMERVVEAITENHNAA